MAEIGKIQQDGAARTLLPQITKKELPGFIKHLQADNVDVSAKYISADRLKPVQKNYNKEKVEGMKADIDNWKGTPLIVSKECYIMDGHHRWVAMNEVDEKHPVRIIQIQLPIAELIKTARSYSGSSTKTIREGRIKLSGLLKEDVYEIPLTEAIRDIDRQIDELKKMKQDIIGVRVPLNKLIRTADKLSSLSDRQMKNDKWKKARKEFDRQTQVMEKKLGDLGLIGKGQFIAWDLLEIK